MMDEGLTGREDGQLSFVLYDNWRAQLMRLDLTQRGILLTNIFARRASQPLLEMDPVTDMLFSIICDQLDRDAAKWELKRERRRAAGAAGGRASARARQQLAELEAKSTDASEAEAKQAGNGTVTATETVTVNATANGTGNAAEPVPPAGEAASLRAPAVARVMKVYMEKVNPTPSRLCIDQLADFAQTLGAEACVHAIQVALDEKKTGWSYIRGILRGYREDGVRCLADIQAREAKRDRTKRIEKNGGFQTHGGAISERARKAVQQALAEAEEEGEE